MKPSFLTLFRRGRYCRPAIEAAESEVNGTQSCRSMQEAERFTAAAIAFAWQHDSEFRHHFWRAICRFPGDPPLSDKAEVFVEPHTWADLLVVNPNKTGRHVYAVELKIKANLDDIQNPTLGEFGEPKGYGTLLMQNWGGKGTALHFVLCGWPENLDLTGLPWRLPIQVEQRQWEHLSAKYPQTPMAKDLAFTLGALGIGAFPAAEVANMKLKPESSELSKACNVLAEVQRRLRWPEGKTKKDFNISEGFWWMQVKLLPAETQNAQKLAKVLDSPTGRLAWFGYEGSDDQPFELGVWFYCGSKKRAQKLAHSLSRGRRPWRVDDPFEDGGAFVARPNTHKHSLKSDCDWFCDVFRALGVKIAP